MLQPADLGHCWMRGEGWIGSQPPLVDHPKPVSLFPRPCTNTNLAPSPGNRSSRVLLSTTIPTFSIVEPRSHCKRLVSITRFPIYRPCKIAPIYTGFRSSQQLEKLIVELDSIYTCIVSIGRVQMESMKNDVEISSRKGTKNEREKLVANTSKIAPIYNGFRSNEQTSNLIYIYIVRNETKISNRKGKVKKERERSASWKSKWSE